MVPTTKLTWADISHPEARRGGHDGNHPEESNGPEFLWATLDQGLVNKSCRFSMSSTFGSHDGQSKSSIQTNDSECGEDYEFLVGILREAGLFALASKEERRDHPCPEELACLNIPTHGVRDSQAINRLGLEENGIEDPLIEASCPPQTAFMVDTRTQPGFLGSVSMLSRPGGHATHIAASLATPPQHLGIALGNVIQEMPSDFLAISIGRKGGIAQQTELSPPLTFVLPASSSQRATIGADIWSAFDALKRKNECERHTILQTKGCKRLREVAPIPWLRWRVKDGRSGQFRSKENFETWWSNDVVANGGSLRTDFAYLILQL